MISQLFVSIIQPKLMVFWHTQQAVTVKHYETDRNESCTAPSSLRFSLLQLRPCQDGHRFPLQTTNHILHRNTNCQMEVAYIEVCELRQLTTEELSHVQREIEKTWKWGHRHCNPGDMIESYFHIPRDFACLCQSCWWHMVQPEVQQLLHLCNHTRPKKLINQRKCIQKQQQRFKKWKCIKSLYALYTLLNNTKDAILGAHHGRKKRWGWSVGNAGRMRIVIILNLPYLTFWQCLDRWITGPNATKNYRLLWLTKIPYKYSTRRTSCL